MLVGYARVSTQDQSLESQIDKLEQFGCKRIFTDIASGSKDERPGLKKAMEFLRDEVDTLVVWRLDRLGRTLKHLIEFVNTLNEREIGFKSIEDSIDTTSPTGKFFFHVTGAFAELERNLIRERTKAGLESARARGRLGGRKRSIDMKIFQTAKKLYDQNEMPVIDICDTLGINRRTFYRYLSEFKR